MKPMHKLILLSWIIFSCPGVNGQPLPNFIHTISTVGSTSRYEFVASPLLNRDCFLLDRFNGEVFMIVEDTVGYLKWQHIPRNFAGKTRSELSESVRLVVDPQVPNQVNYQLFLSGVAARFTYLINVNSGTLWWQVQNPDTKRLLFQWQDTPQPSGK